MTTVGSLFAGIGGFDLGFERAGMTTRFQVEKDDQCRRVLSRHWPDVERREDVCDRSALPNVDVLCGGFPCQDISVAGRRAGLAGERSGLFYEFARIIDNIHPSWVVIENVPGLLSSNRGRDMGTVLGTLGDLGYGYAYRVLDAQYFGVAQRRRRVFIVGHARAERAAQVLFEPESSGRDSAPRREAGERAALTLEARSGGVKPAWNTNDIASTLRSRQHGDGVNPPGRGGEDDQNLILSSFTEVTAEGWQPSVGTWLAAHEAKEPHTLICGVTSNETTHPLTARMGRTSNSEDGTGRSTPIVAFHEDQRTGAVYENDHTHALSSSGGGKPGQGYQSVRIDSSVRRLTPVECERLQGFPDGWTDCESDTGRYRMLGNAVCTNVAEWIGRRIMTADQLKDDST